MNDITHPLRLAVGSHSAGSGKGCAMNIRSWENGDKQITDLPACDDPMLGRIVQGVNDTFCTHRDGDLLCPPCSVEVLALAHRIAGSGSTGLSDLELRVVYVRIAAALARGVLHLNGDPRVVAAIEAAEAWAAHPSAAASYASYASYAADAADAADAAAYAANGANGANGGREYMRIAHEAVDLFNELTGRTEATPKPVVTAAAVRSMLSRI